jgi:hypothetical protein
MGEDPDLVEEGPVTLGVATIDVPGVLGDLLDWHVADYGHGSLSFLGGIAGSARALAVI